MSPTASKRPRPVHVGCSGWNYSAWRGPLYPQGLPARRWLECYSERFSTVEVNATFYRLIKREAVIPLSLHAFVAALLPFPFNPFNPVCHESFRGGLAM